MQVAVVGCGRMGRERALAAASFGVETIFLLDEDGSRAELLASACANTHILKGADALFDERPDALFICTPPFCRGPLELHAISSGIPFLVEKPIAVTSAQLQVVRDHLKRTPVLTAVGYMNRYRNSVQHAKAVLRSRHLIGITAHWAGKKYGVPWWGILEQSGGPFNEQATHIMDLLRYFTNGVEPLYAAAQAPHGLETTVLAVVGFTDNGLGSFLYSCEAKDKDIFVVFETAEGVVELRGWDLELVRNTIDESRPDPESKRIFEKETHAFLQAVASGNKNLVLCDFDDAYETQLLMDRVVKMIRPNSPNRGEIPDQRH